MPNRLIVQSDLYVGFVAQRSKHRSFPAKQHAEYRSQWFECQAFFWSMQIINEFIYINMYIKINLGIRKIIFAERTFTFLAIIHFSKIYM